MDKELTADEIIDLLGGTSETARLCEIEPPSVSDWRKYGIPHARLMYIKAVRPDIFAPQPVQHRSTDTPPEPSRSGRQPQSPSKLMSAAVERVAVLPSKSRL